MKPRTILFLSLLLFLSGAVGAATWSVERDGTGDFTVIQDAVDAAESGDTILIGPGRYPETSDFDYYYNQTVQSCIKLEKSLAIIGAGKDQTFIGPDFGNKNEYGTYGLASRSTQLQLELRDLTFIDCDGHAVLFDMESGGRLMMDDVDTENCWGGGFEEDCR